MLGPFGVRFKVFKVVGSSPGAGNVKKIFFFHFFLFCGLGSRVRTPVSVRSKFVFIFIFDFVVWGRGFDSRCRQGRKLNHSGKNVFVHR